MSTLAESMGLTLEEGRAIAEVACEAAQAGQVSDAAALLEAVVVLNPRDSAAQTLLGTLYESLERWDDADKAYGAATDSGHPTALLKRGELRLRRSDARGLDDLKRLVASNSKLDPQGVLRAKAVLGRRAVAAAPASSRLATAAVRSR
jgi:thioredoxin-like negative regulator of GroEL